MKKILLLFPVLLAFAVPATAQGRAGQLDRSFGKDGRVTTRFGPPARSQSYFAWAGGGRIVAVAGSHLVEYLRDGRLNRSFGVAGRVKISSPEGSSLRPSGLAVDSQGRILVANSASNAVVVRRFLSNGKRDRSFGIDGLAANDFGFPHPLFEGVVQESGPLVFSSGIAVDGADRPLLTGNWVSELSPGGCLYCHNRTQAFVARLQQDGLPDPSFGEGGLFVTSTREGVDSPLPAGETLLFVAAELLGGPRDGSTKPQLGRLLATGGLDAGFGSAGFVELPFYWPPAIGIDRSGRTLLLGTQDEEGSSLYLQRLNPAGMPDQHFGEGGTRRINLPPNPGVVPPPYVLGVDHRDRPVLAVNTQVGKRDYLVVLRRNLRGERDRNFGSNGQVWTRFPETVSPDQILIGGDGKIVVGGTLSEYGLALSRYYGGR